MLGKNLIFPVRRGQEMLEMEKWTRDDLLGHVLSELTLFCELFTKAH